MQCFRLALVGFGALMILGSWSPAVQADGLLDPFNLLSGGEKKEQPEKKVASDRGRPAVKTRQARGASSRSRPKKTSPADSEAKFPSLDLSPLNPFRKTKVDNKAETKPAKTAANPNMATKAWGELGRSTKATVRATGDALSPIKNYERVQRLSGKMSLSLKPTDEKKATSDKPASSWWTVPWFQRDEEKKPEPRPKESFVELPSNRFE